MRFSAAISMMGLAMAFAGCVFKPVRDPGAIRESIRNEVARHIYEFRSCYEKSIEDRPGAQGKLVLQWLIDKDGVPKDVKVKSVDPSLESIGPCAVEVLSRIRFSKPEDVETVDVSYPLYFSENGRIPPGPAVVPNKD